MEERAADDIPFFAAYCLHVHVVGKSCGWNSLDGHKMLVNAILDGPISSY